MAEAEGASADTSRRAFVPTLVAVAVVTVCAVSAASGMAWLEAVQTQKDRQAAATCSLEQKQKITLGDALTSIVELPSIVTNLEGEGAPWLRMDVSVVLPVGTPQKERLAAELSQDFLGYLRTLPVNEISGGTNFYLLKRDLRDIARSRTEEPSADVLIRTFVIE